MIHNIPSILIQFIITIGFSFIVGLEFRNYLRINQYHYGFGSTRTFLLVGILGFMLYQLNRDGLFFAMGMGILGAMLLAYYWHQSTEKQYSLLEVILTLLVFLIGPVSIIFPGWFLVLFVVILILILGETPLIRQLAENLAHNEIVTLAKFLILSGVILPLLPDKQLAPSLPVTYYKVWLAVIIVSGFSYLSYLAQTYFFKTRGLLLTGFLGGLYSSTVTSMVIGRRAHLMQGYDNDVSSALIMATAMMYFRLLVMIFFLNSAVGKNLLIPFFTLIVLSGLIIFGLLYLSKTDTPNSPASKVQHPLELSTAILFAVIFVFFAFLTQYVINNFGHHGLNFLSIVVGFTDIDPFILSLLSGKFSLSHAETASTIIIASGSNNLLKASYALILARNRSVLFAVIWLLFLFIISILYVFT